MTNIAVTETPALFEGMAAHNQSLAAALKEYSIDLDALAKVEGMTTARWTVSWRQDKWWSAQDPWLWQIKENTGMVSAFAGQPRRVVVSRTSWDESLARTPGVCDVAESWGSGSRGAEQACRAVGNGSDWRIAWQRTRALPQPGGRNAREALTQALVTADASGLVSGFTDLNTNVGHEHEIRLLTSIVTRLPEDRFEEVNGTDLSNNLVIRRLCHPTKGGWVYVVNPGFWEFQGTLSLQVSSGDTVVYDISDDSEVKAGVLNLHLPAFGIAAWRSVLGCVDAASTTMSPIARAELAHMTDIFGLVANHSHSLPQPQQDIASRVGGRALSMLARQEYAAAWSIIKVPEYWTLWQGIKGEAPPP